MGRTAEHLEPFMPISTAPSPPPSVSPPPPPSPGRDTAYIARNKLARIPAPSTLLPQTATAWRRRHYPDFGTKSGPSGKSAYTAACARKRSCSWVARETVPPTWPPGAPRPDAASSALHASSRGRAPAPGSDAVNRHAGPRRARPSSVCAVRTMRAASACVQCRQRKTRCVRSSAASGCGCCARREETCSLLETAPLPPARSAAAQARQGQSRRQRISPVTHDAGADADTAASSIDLGDPLRPLPFDASRVVDDYLLYIHDRPHSLFHEPTLRRAARDGTLDRSLLLAICAISCRFSDDARTRGLAMSLYRQAQLLFHQNMEHLSLETIQTCILLANICGAEARPASEASYFGMAVRQAQLLRLHALDVGDSPVLAETKKRVYLSLFMADRWYSSGLGLSPLLTDHELPLTPAIDEYEFHAPDFGLDSTAVSSRPGLWSYRTEIARIFGRIQSFNASLVRRGMDEDEINQKRQALDHELDAWQTNLPEHVKFNHANLNAYIAKNQGGAFVDLHLGFHHYATLLCFPCLGTQDDPMSRSQLYVEKSKRHALQFSDLLAIGSRHNGCKVVHYTIGHMTVISSSVLLYSFLSDNEPNPEVFRQGLVHNFETIIELERLWPGLDKWIERLLTFQETCHDLPLSTAYTMDDWMLRFLSEYHLPLNRKVDQFTLRDFLNATQNSSEALGSEGQVEAQTEARGPKQLEQAAQYDSRTENHPS